MRNKIARASLPFVLGLVAVSPDNATAQIVRSADRAADQTTQTHDVARSIGGHEGVFYFSNFAELALGHSIDNALTPRQSLPFEWKFFGQPATGFFISDSGYTTVDSTARTRIATSSALTDPSVPRNSSFAFRTNIRLDQGQRQWDTRVWTAALDTAPQRAGVLTQAASQSPNGQDNNSISNYRFSASTTWLSFDNFGEERTNTHHYELHLKYALTPRDKIGVKFATWSLFQPMGIQWWDGVVEKAQTGSERYPGRLRETGVGISYQRVLWRGLFSTVEVLPQHKTYLDEDNMKIGNGFKLYTSYHIGYHIALLNNRVFLEPQIHSQYWPIDTRIPQGFREQDTKWKNYFLFEPNLYVGVKF